jgi:hypothetical protein
MDEAERRIIEQNLVEAEQAVAQGHEHIVRQKRVITDLMRDGYDIGPATDLLNTLQKSQKLHVQHRDRLRSELGLDP